MSQKHRVGAALQSAVGTPVTTMTHWIPVTSANVDPNREELEITETAGRRAPDPTDLGSKSYQGSIAGAVRPNSFPLWKTAAFGTPATTVLVAAAAWQHIWNPDGTGSEPRPLSLMLIADDSTTPIVDFFSDVFITGLKVSCARDDYMLYELKTLPLHMDLATADPGAVVHDATSKFPFNALGVQLSVNGAALAELGISDFEIDYDGKFEVDEVNLGSLEADGATSPGYSITGSFNVTGVNNVSPHYRRALLETPDQCRLVITAAGATISGAHKYAEIIDIKHLRYISAPIALEAASMLNKIKVDFKAFWSTSDSKAMEWTTVNTDDGADLA